MGTVCHRYSAINVQYCLVLCSGFAGMHPTILGGSLPHQDLHAKIATGNTSSRRFHFTITALTVDWGSSSRAEIWRTCWKGGILWRCHVESHWAIQYGPFYCQWRLYGCVIHFINLSAMGVAEIAKYGYLSLYICVYIVYITLNKNINATCKVLVPCFMSWNKISQKCSIHTKNVFLSNVAHKFVYIPVSENFYFAKIIYPPDRCGISRSWLNSVIITQVHLVLGTIKGHSKMSSFVTQHNATDVSRFGGLVQLACWLQECPPVLLPDNWMLISLP